MAYLAVIPDGKDQSNEALSMAGRHRQIRDEHGQTINGTVVNVQESTERWTDVRLVDGTTFRIKVVVDEVVMHDGRRDSEGNPVYSIFSPQRH